MCLDLWFCTLESGPLRRCAWKLYQFAFLRVRRCLDLSSVLTNLIIANYVFLISIFASHSAPTSQWVRTHLPPPSNKTIQVWGDDRIMRLPWLRNIYGRWLRHAAVISFRIHAGRWLFYNNCREWARFRSGYQYETIRHRFILTWALATFVYRVLRRYS